MAIFKLIIAGSRDFCDYNLCCQKVDNILSHKTSIEIVHGAARGADDCGRKYGETKGYTVTAFPADWDKFGKRAGYLRNRQMGEYVKNHIISGGEGGLVTFWDGISPGTKSMLEIAEELGIPTRIIYFK